MDQFQETTDAISSPPPTQGRNITDKNKINTNKNSQEKTQEKPSETVTHESTKQKPSERNDRHMPAPRELVADLCSLTEDYELALGELRGEKLVFIRLPALEPSGGAPLPRASATPWTDLRSLECEQHLQRISARQFDRGATREVTSEVVRHLEGKGLDLAPRPMATRIGFVKEKLYIDLGCKLGLAVEIDPLNSSGYRVISDPPLIFRRPADFGELPVPTVGGTRLIFDPYFPNLSAQSRDALLGVLLSCLSQNGCFPVTFLTGPEGSGKSVCADLIRRIIDPLKSGGGRVTLPSKVEDLMTIVASGYLATFDNASRIHPDLSDALCQVSTGGTLQVRKLYAQGQTHASYVKNPLILSSVALPHERQDLLSRSVILEFQPLGKAIKHEDEFKASFAKDLPCILGWLYSAVATSLRDARGTRVTPSSRLVETEAFVSAAEPQLGCGDGAIVSAWNRARDSATSDVKGADPVLALLQEKLPGIGCSISGTTTQLREQLVALKTDESGRVSVPSDFPKHAQAFGSHLARTATLLAAEGFELIKPAHTHAGSVRTITRIALVTTPGAVVTVTRPPAAARNATPCTVNNIPALPPQSEPILGSAA